MQTRREILIAAAVSATVAAAGRPVFAKGTGRIFISNEKTNDITVLGRDFSPMTTIPTSRRPRDMHFNQDKSLLYVACGDDDTIDVIDVESLKVVDTIPTGPSPEMFTFSGDWKSLWVSDEEDSRVERIEIESKIVVDDVPTGPEPEGVIVSEDGKFLYATSEVADMVHAIDLDTGRVVKNIVVGTRPRRFVLSPDGDELWVSCELSSEVDVIDRRTHEVSDKLFFVPPGFRPEDVTPVGMAITNDGTKVLVTLGRANHLAIVDRKSRDVLAYVLVGDRAWGVDLSRDEKSAIVTNGLSDNITVVDMASMKAEQSISVGRKPHSVLIDD